MSGKGCWLIVLLAFVAAAGVILWVRAEEYRMVNLCITVGGTWDYQANLCHF